AATTPTGSPAPTDINAIRGVENLFIDNWESYPVQRNQIIDFLRDNAIKNTVFVTGDSHASWVYDVTKLPVLYPLAANFNLPQPNPYNATTKEGYNPVTGDGSFAVEICTPSIASQNFDEAIGEPQAAIFEQVINIPQPLIPGNPNYNPHLKFVDLDRHGYFVLDVRADSLQTDYFYVPNVTQASTTESWGRGIVVRNGQTRVANANVSQQAPAKAVQDTPAPDPSVILAIEKNPSESVIFTIYPNPTQGKIHLHYGLAKTTEVQISIRDLQGKTVKVLSENRRQTAGVYDQNAIDISDLKAGTYLLTIKTGKNTVTRKIVVQ
ncbi:MAG: alkaline phosphatase D family protein, partial [Verrucomicrobia bacterium]|nr:alkaline phosphatase D family protein [Cytophagales bacterium]